MWRRAVKEIEAGERRRTDRLGRVLSTTAVLLLAFAADDVIGEHMSTVAFAQPSTAPYATGTKVRSLDELIDRKQPGIELVRSWIRAAKNPVEELKAERSAGERALVGLQVTSRSPMGAIALETGGLLVDHGWIRVLGGGHRRLPRPIR